MWAVTSLILATIPGWKTNDDGVAILGEEAREVLKKFNPIKYADKWSTPQLLIDGDNDYRMPETDGIGAFHTLFACLD